MTAFTDARAAFHATPCKETAQNLMDETYLQFKEKQGEDDCEAAVRDLLQY